MHFGLLSPPRTSRHSNHTTLCISFFLHFVRLPATFSLGYVSRHIQPAFLAVFCRIRFIYYWLAAGRLPAHVTVVAGGLCFKMEKVNFPPADRLLHTRQNGGLHKKAVCRVAEKGGTGCRKGQPSGPCFSAAQLNVQPTCPSSILWCSLPGRPSVQLAKLRKIHVFH